ncbi:hypothetical protein GT043_33150 [Streptomyces sp. SID2131]|nr:hypothetical protein [Streptomyces sp. SID2131]
MERGIGVDNEAGVVVIGDGNTVGFGTGAGTRTAVRSAYREQVRRIAPPELAGREEELAELAEFCRTGTGYRWWRADAWAGKTALMAWLALDPPPGVRIVPFFVTARLGAQNDVVAYVDVVLEQLAELAGEGLPALLTAATREAHLLRLYASAAGACAARGERLVLLVDGLDEDRGVTTGPDAHSIAALLPYGTLDLPVVVSGRLNPPLPADVPEDHPLGDPSIVRLLSSSPKARAIRAEAERELKHFLTGGGLPYELLGLLTAAGGGLTADDLAELTGEVPYRVRDVLRTGPGRTFALRGEAYLLAHEELVVQAREMLGARELGRWRAALCDWAGEWRARGWPDGTPGYLLHGWFPMLRAAGDLDRMLACALDEGRHARLSEETGGIGEALGEVRATGEAVLERGERAELVVTMLRLGFRRSELTRRNGEVPAALAASWAAAGQVERAVAMVHGENRVATVEGLCAVAARLLDLGDRERAESLVAEAEELVLGQKRRLDRDRMTGHLVPLLLATGALDGAERLFRSVESTHERGGPLLALLDALCAAGEHERAAGLARAEQHDGLRARAVDRVHRALLAAGRVDEAGRVLREAVAEHEKLGPVLFLDGSRALREAGCEERGDALFTEALRTLDADRPFSAASQVVRALAAAGTWGHVREALARAPEDSRAFFLYEGVEGLIEAGRLDEADERLVEIPPQDAEGLRERLAESFVRAGRLDRARALIEGLDGAWRDGPVREYAQALCAADRLDRATALVEGGGRAGAFAGIGVADALLEAGDRTAALGFLVSAERVLRAPTSGTATIPVARAVEALAGVPGQEDAACALLGAAERRGGDENAWWLVSPLVATGQRERAERAAWSTEEWARPSSLHKVLEAHLGAGEHESVVNLAERAAHNGGYERTLLSLAAVGGLAKAGSLEQAMCLALAQPSYEAPEACALVAAGMAEAGRAEEAAEWIARVRTSLGGEVFSAVVPDLVRAWLALDRREEAVLLVERARAAVGPPYVSSQAPYLARALVLLGRYEEAVSYASEADPPNAAELLLSAAKDLLAADEYERVATVLAGLHPLGRSCAEVYAELARVHPDPGRAHRFAALALHLGTWSDAVAAVLHLVPRAVPLVLAEAERLLGDPVD